MSQPGREDMWLVECPRCSRPKAPRGCVPVNDAETKDYCTRSCPGYETWPYPSAAPQGIAASTVRIDYDDDQLSVVEKINAALEARGLVLVDDDLDHDGYCLYTLQVTPRTESAP